LRYSPANERKPAGQGALTLQASQTIR
jgi:hypothetical protein